MTHRRILTNEEAVLLIEIGLDYEYENGDVWINMPLDPWEINGFVEIMSRWGNKEEGEEDLVGDLLAELYRVEVV